MNWLRDWMELPAPDPGWLEWLRMTFGFLLIATLGVLSFSIALGKVEASTSHGLESLLECLKILVAQFAMWCFISGRKEASKDKEE